MRNCLSLLALLALIGVALAQGVSMRINVNTAARDQLELLPGIGSKTSLEITKNRPYTTAAEFQSKVKGIGASSWAKLQRFVVFSGQTEIKINVNTASKDDLEFLPGVGPKIAAQIVKNRPYKDAADFQDKVKGIAENQWAKLKPYVVFDPR